MPGHRIIIEVQPGGAMTTTVEGAPGRTCEDVSRWLDRLGRVTEHRPTADARLEARAGAGATTRHGGGHGQR